MPPIPSPPQVNPPPPVQQPLVHTPATISTTSTLFAIYCYALYTNCVSYMPFQHAPFMPFQLPSRSQPPMPRQQSSSPPTDQQSDILVYPLNRPKSPTGQTRYDHDVTLKRQAWKLPLLVNSRYSSSRWCIRMRSAVCSFLRMDGGEALRTLESCITTDHGVATGYATLASLIRQSPCSSLLSI